MGRSRSRSRSRGRRNSRSRSRSRSPDREYFRIHVADLCTDPDKREIERKFERYGPVIEVWVARNPPCFAFVVFKYKDDAEMAIREMDGQVISGCRVRCSFARPRKRGGRAGNDNNRCYRCGEEGHFSRECYGFTGGRRNTFGFSRRSRSRSRSPRGRRSRSRSPARRPRERSRSRSRSRERRRKRDSFSRSPSRSRSRSRSKQRKSSTSKSSQRRSPEEESRYRNAATPPSD